MIIENLSTLKIHKLTRLQYERELEAGNIDENALYLTPDETTLLDYATIEQVNTAVAGKANINDLISHTDNRVNPHKVTLSQLGITATADELNYIDGVTSNIQTQLNSKASMAIATTNTAGLMSAADKIKLDNAATISDIESYVNEVILGGSW